MRKSLHFRAAAGTVFFSLIGVAAVICLWYLAVRFTSIGLLLPTPGEVLERLLYTCTHPIGRTYTLPMHLLAAASVSTALRQTKLKISSNGGGDFPSPV